MQLAVNIFFEKGGEYVFAPGSRELLLAVKDFGSLLKATQKLGVSYRWAWGHIKDEEKRLGITLLERTAHARCGRPKVLTYEARELLSWFDMAEKDLRRTLSNNAKSLPVFLQKNQSRETGVVI